MLKKNTDLGETENGFLIYRKWLIDITVHYAESENRKTSRHSFDNLLTTYRHQTWTSWTLGSLQLPQNQLSKSITKQPNNNQNQLSIRTLTVATILWRFWYKLASISTSKCIHSNKILGLMISQSLQRILNIC